MQEAVSGKPAARSRRAAASHRALGASGTPKLEGSPLASRKSSLAPGATAAALRGVKPTEGAKPAPTAAASTQTDLEPAAAAEQWLAGPGGGAEPPLQATIPRGRRALSQARDSACSMLAT